MRIILDGYANHALDNYDTLMRIGINLAGAGFRTADLWATRWAAESPSAARLEIAATLAWGLWNPSFPGVTISREAVEQLLALREQVHPEDGIDYVVLMALADAALRSEVRELLLPVLARLQGHVVSYPDMTENLQSAIKRALK
ncbi:MAG TPA: hypothetical protein VHO06_26845 [Polyangia bacterium]|nr:hypothetical protein [Polyangia bacterium]